MLFLGCGAGAPSSPPGTPAPPPAAPVEVAEAEEAAPTPTVTGSEAPLGEAMRRARGAVGLSQGVAAPRGWECEAAQRRLRPRQRRRWSDDLAAQASPSLLARLPAQERARWPLLRWRYVERGVCHPEALIEGGAVEVSFFGQVVRAHPELALRLARAQRAVEGELDAAPFAWAGSLSPRMVRGPFRRPPTRISNHALGQAVDLDPSRNPYLSTRELALIEEVTGARLRRAAALSARERWESFHAASARWQEVAPPLLERAGALRLAMTTRRLRPAERRLLRVAAEIEGSQNLTRALTEGFLSLPLPLVLALERSGLSWATHFQAGADLMHFELPR